MFELTIKEENKIIEILKFKTREEITDWIFEDISNRLFNSDMYKLELLDTENKYWGTINPNCFWFKDVAWKNNNKTIMIYYKIKEDKNMNNFDYYFNVDEKVILETIINNWDYDGWGEVEYSNDEKGVDYNIYIDNSTNETIFGSAFYKIFKNKNNRWQHDTSQYYPYEINFKDPNWKVNLKNESKKAYKTLWEKNEKEIIQ